MKKNKKIMTITASLLILGLFSIGFVKANQSDFFTELGKDVKEHSDDNKQINKYGDFKIAKKGIYSTEKTKLGSIKEIGNDVIVTDEQIDAAKDFFTNSGFDEEKAKSKAKIYVEEENALYALAIKNGFDVTQDEVNEYVDKLTKMYKKAENKEDVDKVINVFNSEEEYWKYEKKVYKKLLPIQKYTMSLKEKFIEKNSDKYDEEKISEMWDQELECITKNAVKSQKYSVVNEKTKISELKKYWVEK